MSSSSPSSSLLYGLFLWGEEWEWGGWLVVGWMNERKENEAEVEENGGLRDKMREMRFL